MTRSKTDAKKLIEISRINAKMVKNPGGLIKRADEFYSNILNGITRHIADRHREIHFVFIAGPSASGKTTSANLLRRKLAWFGIHAVTVSLDNFFIDNDKIMPEEDGSFDFEKPEVIDIRLFNLCMHELLDKREAKFPVFDFHKHARSDKTLEIKMRQDNAVILIEGIHALNPALYDAEINEHSVKIYVVPNRHFAYRNEIVLSANALRLMRRMYRDHLTRGKSVADTLNMWPSVNRGTELYVKPYKKDADFVVDTTHAYEPYLYKNVLLPLLDSVEPRAQAQNLIRPLERLKAQVTENDISATSLINEFLGKESMFY